MTAVQWLVEQLEERRHIIPDHIEVTSLEMEKQQIIDAWNDVYGHIKDAEQYYNETFKKD
jgi:hypothetical protein